jgi:hypothetical protein
MMMLKVCTGWMSDWWTIAKLLEQTVSINVYLEAMKFEN